MHYDRPPRDQRSTRQDTGAIDDGNRRISGELSIVGLGEASLPEQFVKIYKECNESADARDKKRFIVEGVTLFFVFIVAIFGGIQSCESIKSADATQKATNNSVHFFRTDERAWVEIEGIEHQQIDPFMGMPGITFRYHLTPKNVGKTVAKEVRVYYILSSGDSSFGKDKNRIDLAQRVDIAPKDDYLYRWAPQSLAPGSPSAVPISIFGRAPQKTINPKVVWYSFLVGRIDYKSAFGTDHWVKFCYVIFNDLGELEHCEYGNEEDNNAEQSP